MEQASTSGANEKKVGFCEVCHTIIMTYPDQRLICDCDVDPNKPPAGIRVKKLN